MLKTKKNYIKLNSIPSHAHTNFRNTIYTCMIVHSIHVQNSVYLPLLDSHAPSYGHLFPHHKQNTKIIKIQDNFKIVIIANYCIFYYMKLFKLFFLTLLLIMGITSKKSMPCKYCILTTLNILSYRLKIKIWQICRTN